MIILLGVGGRLTVKHDVSLRKVLPHSGPGYRSRDKGVSPCRDAETTQPLELCDDSSLLMRSPMGFGETVNLLLEQAQTVGSVVQTAHR